LNVVREDTNHGGLTIAGNVVREDMNHGGLSIKSVVREDMNHGGLSIKSVVCEGTNHGLGMWFVRTPTMAGLAKTLLLNKLTARYSKNPCVESPAS
jgi:hypothetical protein